MQNHDNPRKLIFLDTETTGLHPPRDKLVEIAMVDGNGDTLLDTLVNPGQSIGDAKRFHGITDQMVQNAPSLRELWPGIEAMISGADLVIYNAEFDTKFFPKRLQQACSISCAMHRFAGVYGDWDAYHQSFKWKQLRVAMDFAGGQWIGKSHRARADALACRTVWNWMEDQAAFGDRLPVAAGGFRQ